MRMSACTLIYIIGCDSVCVKIGIDQRKTEFDACIFGEQQLNAINTGESDRGGIACDLFC